MTDLESSLRDSLEASLSKLKEGVDSVTRKKPAFLELSANLLAALQEGNLTVLSTSEDFQTVTDGVLKAKETKSASLSHRLGDGLFRLVPLAGIALGVTGFAADASGFSPLGLVVTGLGSVLAFAIEVKERGEAIVAQLNDISYSHRFVHRIIRANRNHDTDIVNGALRLLTALNVFLGDSLLYLSTSSLVNAIKSLGTRSVDSSRATLADAIQGFRSTVQDKVNSIALEKDEEEKDLALNQWFEALNFREVQSRHEREACEGTGLWFLEDAEIMTFMNGGTRRLWCHGQAGVGKTVLVSLLVASLKQQLRDKPKEAKRSSEILLYVYCDVNDQERQVVTAILSSIAAQILQARLGDIRTTACAFHEAHQERRPDHGELMDFIVASLRGLSQVYLIVDAVDELSIYENFSDQVSILSGRLRAAGTPLAVFTTSRSDKIPHWYQPNYVLYIETPVADLKHYVDTRIKLRSPTTFSLDQGSRKLIVDTITSGAENRFILGRLQLDGLYRRRPGSPGDLKAVLSHLSADLDEFYDKSMQIIKEDRDDALRLLSWLIVPPKAVSEHRFKQWESVHPTRRRGPLSLPELGHVLAIHPSQTVSLSTLQNFMLNLEYLIDACSGMCKFDRDSNVVIFPHPTVQEYLLKNEPSLFSSLEIDKCRACIAYLSLEEFKAGACTTMQQWEIRLETFPFIEYAAHHWCEIRGLSRSWESVNQALHTEIVGLLSHEGLVSTLAQVLAYSCGWMKNQEVYVPKTSGLIIAMQFNLLDVMQALLEKGADPNFVSETGQTALDLAITADPPYTKLLLHHHAAIRDATGRDALKEACKLLSTRSLWGGHLIVKMLGDADPSVAPDERLKIHDSIKEIEALQCRTMMPETMDSCIRWESRKMIAALDQDLADSMEWTVLTPGPGTGGPSDPTSWLY
ncbi:hypothetical protein LTR96_009314 [Exophiala xenobiotica]|nr:hypothetical protein LTR96_009314 [Exophiala xenobiotica]KAK5288445.1 hypothetical protein LTR14_008304 [Exophiala xenobiotica]KAK5476720.1 hypothetical protein LTR55_008774 [Exophiala xenobiotica]